MESSRQDLITAANNTGNYNLVQDSIVLEPSDYPLFCIIDDSVPLGSLQPSGAMTEYPLTSNHEKYDAQPEIRCAHAAKKDGQDSKTKSQLEQIWKDFLVELGKVNDTAYATQVDVQERDIGMYTCFVAIMTIRTYESVDITA